MLRIMVLTYFLVAVSSLVAVDRLIIRDVQNSVSYTGVYQGKPLFVQNPYLPDTKSYCISAIIINRKRVNLNYKMSALILDFKGISKFSPVSIHIEYSESTCTPILLNPESIRYHSVFSFEESTITDSSLVWKTKGEESNASYEVEIFDLGYWQSADVRNSKGTYGGSAYLYFPVYEEGSNKYRIKYTSGDIRLYSKEMEHVFYPEPVTFKRKGNLLILSRSCNYVVSDEENHMILMESGKEINIADLKHGEYHITFNDKQTELFRKKDRVKVIRKVKSNN